MVKKWGGWVIFGKNISKAPIKMHTSVQNYTQITMAPWFFNSFGKVFRFFGITIIFDHYCIGKGEMTLDDQKIGWVGDFR